MRFKWLSKQSVECDAGFIVTFTGRSSLEYREGRRHINIHIEDGYVDGEKPATIVFAGSITQWMDFPWRISISAQDKRRVLKNLQLALEFQNLVFVLNEGAHL